MALSEQEQRLLEQMEAALAAEDPKLASALRGTTVRTLHRRRAAVAGLGFIVGVVALVAGLEVHPAISIVGFIVMLVSTIAALTSWRHVDDSGVHRPPSRPKAPHGDSAFMDKLEERWRRRKDEGL